MVLSHRGGPLRASFLRLLASFLLPPLETCLDERFDFRRCCRGMLNACHAEEFPLLRVHNNISSSLHAYTYTEGCMELQEGAFASPRAPSG